MIAALVVTGSLAPGAPTRHEACASRQHHCAATTEILTCCCGHDANTASVSAVLETRNSLSVAAVLRSAPARDAGSASTSISLMTLAGDLPRDRPPDLSILFADLRL